MSTSFSDEGNWLKQLIFFIVAFSVIYLAFNYCGVPAALIGL